jgi:hypothetical protein
MTAPRAERAITVLVDEQQRPAAFRLGRRRLEVQRVLDEWEEAGCWWRGEEPRRVYRVLAEGAIYELHHLSSSGWELQRVYD